MRKQAFAYAKAKVQISCTVTVQPINAFVFATKIVHPLYFLNLHTFKYTFSCPWPSSEAAQPGLCWTWSESQKTGFLMSQLILVLIVSVPSLCLNNYLS